MKSNNNTNKVIWGCINRESEEWEISNASSLRYFCYPGNYSKKSSLHPSSNEENEREEEKKPIREL